MENSGGSGFPDQKFKVVEDANGKKWVKEMKNPGDPSCKDAYRHHVIVGPKGGEYFIGNDGVKRYISNVHHLVHVYPEDTRPEIPDEGTAYHGFGNKKH